MKYAKLCALGLVYFSSFGCNGKSSETEDDGTEVLAIKIGDNKVTVLNSDAYLKTKSVRVSALSKNELCKPFPEGQTITFAKVIRDAQTRKVDLHVWLNEDDAKEFCPQFGSRRDFFLYAGSYDPNKTSQAVAQNSDTQDPDGNSDSSGKQGSQVQQSAPTNTIGTSEAYRQLYQPFFKTSNTLMDKIVNDSGKGYETLYGVRNMRVVLHGIMYRGGSKNEGNKYGSRDNENPMPTSGLDNLCKEGFSKAVYLYTTNYKPYSTTCDDRWGKKNSFEFVQISPSGGGIKKILQLVHSSIMGSSSRPIYTGCWNGWHNSGLISALALRQWCGFTGDEAVQYWIDGTDSPGNANYPDKKSTIRAFKPFSDLAISEDTKQKLCPLNRYHK